MDFKEEFNKFKESWEKMPVLGRLILFASFITSFMSISSLSETIVEFHGFLASGIEFYRNVSANFFVPFLKVLNIQINQLQTDSLILLTIATAWTVRYQYRVSTFFILVDLLFWGIFAYAILNHDTTTALGYVVGLILAIIVFGALPFFSIKARNRRSIMAFNYALVSLTFLFLSVCVLAAISNAISTILGGT